MKVNLYLDVYDPAVHPLLVSQPLYATSAPGEKMQGAKRFKISVDIPNNEVLWAGKIDGVLPIEELLEVDKG